MRTTPLHDDFGLEILGADLRDVDAGRLYPEIRALFERHSLLLFRDQHLSDAEQIAFAQLFGPIEDRSRGANGPMPRISPVSNLDESGEVVSQTDWRLLNLKSNQLWHTDSTFLPVPALANILAARVVSRTGGQTELVSTRAAWRRLPAELKARTRDAVLLHRYAHSRARIDPELAKEELFTMWDDQAWPAVWRNPITDEDALYIASHAYAVAGMPPDEGVAFIDELITFATPDDAVYAHDWRVGDLLVWDERATMHRGRPWPHEEERTLVSLCVSVGDADGLTDMRARRDGCQ